MGTVSVVVRAVVIIVVIVAVASPAFNSPQSDHKAAGGVLMNADRKQDVTLMRSSREDGTKRQQHGRRDSGADV